MNIIVDLTPRQEFLLSLIIREYVRFPKNSGVSSKTLVMKYGLDISAATVRSETVALTNAGVVCQPYTSAGRIPTEDGYRYFVQHLVRGEKLPTSRRRLISHQFHQARAHVDQWSRLTAAVLAHHTQSAALVTALHSKQARFKHLELISTRDRQVLVVLVLQGGEVLQQMIKFDASLLQPELSKVAVGINHVCYDLAADAIERQASGLDSINQKVITLIVAVMRRADAFVSGEVYLDGLQNVLAEREFVESHSARQVVRLLEKRTFLEEFLSQALSPQIGGVQVVIAGEGNWDELRECSMVLARYGAADIATGALGVFGPTRMAYDRAIGTVQYVASLLTNLVGETYG